MKSPSLVLAGALAAAGLLLFFAWQLLHDPEAQRPPTIESATDERIPSPPAEELSSADPERVRSPAPASAVDVDHAPELPQETPATLRNAALRIRGRVLDMRGEPLAGVTVGSDGNGTKILARSDALGVFDVEVDRAGRRLIAISDEWVTVRDDLVLESNREREHFVIVAPSIAIGGRVIDPAGRGLEGARVVVELPIAAFASFPFPLDSTGLRELSTACASDGAFELRAAPAAQGSRVEASAEGFSTNMRDMPRETTLDLLIELTRPEPKDSSLEGVVVHVDGSPAAGAKVVLGNAQTETDAHGRFTLSFDRVQPETPLVAVKEGFQAAVLPEFGRFLRSVDMHPQPEHLVLGPPALSIAGRVLEADGSPAERWTVRLIDGTQTSEGRMPPETAEKLASGGTEQVLTGKDGAFRIRGLLAREYRLVAYGRKGVKIDSPPIPAGREDVVLQAPADAIVERISGRVTARDGAPLGNVVVTVSLVTIRTSFGWQSNHLSSTTTKADGAFELSNVPRRSVQLHVGGDPVMPMEFDLEGVDLARPIEIVAARRCHFRFEGEAGAEAPTGLAILDSDGHRLVIWSIQSNMTMSTTHAELSEGRSPVLSVSEEARRLVLYRKGQELSIRPVNLVPGEIVVIRPE